MESEWIPLTEADTGALEQDFIAAALTSGQLGQGRLVGAFEGEFARWLGHKHAVAVGSSTLALLMALRALGLGEQDEVIASPHSWHQIARAIPLAGCRAVFADVDYWSGTLAPGKAADKVTPATRAILAGNTNGHPADWNGLRKLADERGLKLIEDCTESIGSRYAGKPVGSFGDVAIFDFSQTSTLCCGEGAMLVTDDSDLAHTLRYLRDRQPEQRFSLSITTWLPFNARISEVTAALGLAQLRRIDELLAKRRQVALWYEQQMKSFEGIKPPYLAPEVDEVNWFLYTVHLGTRFSLSSTRSIVEDLKTAAVEAELYCRPLNVERWFLDRGWRKKECFVAEKLADRAIALPFHTGLDEEQVTFIVKTAKDASVNVGAGAAIYL